MRPCAHLLPFNRRRYCDTAETLLKVERKVDVEEFIALRDMQLHRSRARSRRVGADGVVEQDESTQFDLIRGLIVTSLSTSSSTRRTMVRGCTLHATHRILAPVGLNVREHAQWMQNESLLTVSLVLVPVSAPSAR